MGGWGQYPSDLLGRWIAIPAEKGRERFKGGRQSRLNKLIVRRPRPPCWRGSTSPGGGGVPFPGHLRFTCSRLQAERVSQLGLCLQSPAVSKPSGHISATGEGCKPRSLLRSSGREPGLQMSGSLKHMSFLQKDGRLVPEAGAQPFRGRVLGPGFDSDTPPSLSRSPGICQIVEPRELNPCPAQSFFNLTRTFPCMS